MKLCFVLEDTSVAFLYSIKQNAIHKPKEKTFNCNVFDLHTGKVMLTTSRLTAPPPPPSEGRQLRIKLHFHIILRLSIYAKRGRE